MLSLVVRALSHRARPGGRDRRGGSRVQSQDRGRLAAGRHGPAGGRHRPEPAEPAGRVRSRGAGPGSCADPGHRPVRRAGSGTRLPRPGRPDARDGVGEQRLQPADHRARTGDGRDAAHRPGGGGGLHGAGAAPAALPRDAGFAGRHGQAHPSRGPGQRRRRGAGRLAGRRRAGPGGLAGLPAASRVERAPRDRHVPAAVGGDRRRDGPGRAGHVLRCLQAGPGHHQDSRRDRPVRAARRHPSRSTARPCPA